MRLYPKSYPTTRLVASLHGARLIILTAFVFASTMRTHAALLLVEPFNYPDGPLVTVSAGAWTTHSGTAGQTDVIAGL